MALTDERFDPGLQPERTELAWRRTVLAVAVGALVGIRVLTPVVGAWALVVGLVGLGSAGTVGVLARVRARRMALALHEPGRRPPGGGLLLALSVLVVVAAALGVLVVLHRALDPG